MNHGLDLPPSVPPVIRISPPVSGTRDVRRWLLLVLILGFGVVLMFSRLQLNVLLPTLQKDFGLTDADYTPRLCKLS